MKASIVCIAPAMSIEMSQVGVTLFLFLTFLSFTFPGFSFYINNLKFKRKIQTWTGIQTSDLQISSLAFYHLSYPGSIDGTGLNLLLESKAIQVLWSVTPCIMI